MPSNDVLYKYCDALRSLYVTCYYFIFFAVSFLIKLSCVLSKSSRHSLYDAHCYIAYIAYMMIAKISSFQRNNVHHWIS